MLPTLMKRLNQKISFETAKAHCDIPCKIYDPSSAQIAALTILRMVDLIEEAEASKAEQNATYINSLARFIATKEDHGLKCKEEVTIIWGDYFKQPQFDQFPEIHEVCHNIMMLASQCKQTVDRDKALALIEQVNRFAEIFWATKQVSVKRAVCPYPPAVEMVYPDL